LGLNRKFWSFTLLTRMASGTGLKSNAVATSSGFPVGVPIAVAAKVAPGDRR